MQSIAKALAKGTLGTVAAGAMVMGMATPAAAQHHRARAALRLRARATTSSHRARRSASLRAT